MTPASQPVRFLLLITVGLGWGVFAARAQTPDLEIGVRSNVQDSIPHWDKKNPVFDGGHGMIYGILACKQVENVDHLVAPVNEKRVVSLLMDTLDANGFREFVPGEKPLILITASYGRGEMSNPYIRDTGAVGGATSSAAPMSRPPQQADSQFTQDGISLGADGSLPSATIGQSRGSGGQGPQTSDSAPLTQTITGASPMQLFDERTHGYEAKLQKAGYEKLFIRITAWQYPESPKSKAKMLWKTIMVVDDPDHRDLNAVAAAMLAAGGPYFDKVPQEREVEVHKPLPTTQVNVGTIDVREPFKPNSDAGK